MSIDYHQLSSRHSCTMYTASCVIILYNTAPMFFSLRLNMWKHFLWLIVSNTSWPAHIQPKPNNYFFCLCGMFPHNFLCWIALNSYYRANCDILSLIYAAHTHTLISCPSHPGITLLNVAMLVGMQWPPHHAQMLLSRRVVTMTHSTNSVTDTATLSPLLLTHLSRS